ncbi:MAG: formylglycine-generating enzyme family protein [Polyangiaceae bacterium]|nr:formylglycine-generating enzyme family protein [Polyangiaceae bacterium]
MKPQKPRALWRTCLPALGMAGVIAACDSASSSGISVLPPDETNNDREGAPGTSNTAEIDATADVDAADASADADATADVDAADASADADAAPNVDPPDPPPPPPPPPPSCGQAVDIPCELGHDCAVNADCASGLCGEQGPNTNKCVVARSCDGTPGADDACGAAGGEADSCCTSLPVPGGAFSNIDDDGVSLVKATVASFKLDKYEVTVGRLRAFYNAHQGDVRDHPPAPGSGAHPLVPNSGWRESFNERLPGSWDEINVRHVAACAVGGDNTDYGAAVWTDAPGPNEDKPMNCIDWYTLFAFCIWDGGRLPTDAEWSFAAQSGDEARVYPFGNDFPTWTEHHDVIASNLTDPPAPGYKFTEGPMYRSPDDGPLQIAQVGKKSERSAFGQADLTGNVIELTMEEADGRPQVCNNCANVAWPDPPPHSPPMQPPDWQTFDPQTGLPVGDEFGDERATADGIRLARGSSWQGLSGDHPLANGRNRFWAPVWRTYSAIGGRCARN